MLPLLDAGVWYCCFHPCWYWPLTLSIKNTDKMCIYTLRIVISNICKPKVINGRTGLYCISCLHVQHSHYHLIYFWGVDTLCMTTRLHKAWILKYTHTLSSLNSLIVFMLIHFIIFYKTRMIRSVWRHNVLPSVSWRSSPLLRYCFEIF